MCEEEGFFDPFSVFLHVDGRFQKNITAMDPGTAGW